VVAARGEIEAGTKKGWPRAAPTEWGLAFKHENPDPEHKRVLWSISGKIPESSRTLDTIGE
jgi:hypothetical protein